MQDELMSSIAAELGISHMPAEEQQKIIGQFGEVALKAATISILEKLNDPKREEFMKLAQGGDPVALKAFLDQEVPNHEQIAKDAVTIEVQEFKKFQAA